MGDFRDLAARAAVNQVLSRLVRNGRLRNLARDLYDFPKVHPKLGPLQPLIGPLSLARRARAVGRQRDHRKRLLGLLDLEAAFSACRGTTLTLDFKGGTSLSKFGAIRRSLRTCETCGQPRQLRGTRWLYVACDAHPGGEPPLPTECSCLQWRVRGTLRLRSRRFAPHFHQLRQAKSVCFPRTSRQA